MTSPHLQFIALVADDGHEALVPAMLLAAASPSVWAERLTLAPLSAHTTRSIESGISALEIDSFIGVLTLFTPASTMPSLIDHSEMRQTPSATRLDLSRLCAALTLTHKYDCTGLRKLIGHLAAAHFPKCSNSSRIAGSKETNSAQPPMSMPSLTQEHLDYIVRAQELFGDADCLELLNDTCIGILAHALTTSCLWSTCTRFTNGFHYRHCSIAIVDHKPTAAVVKDGEVKEEEPDSVYKTTYDPDSASLHIFCTPFVIDRSRLAPSTIFRVLSCLEPRKQ